MQTPPHIRRIVGVGLSLLALALVPIEGKIGHSAPVRPPVQIEHVSNLGGKVTSVATDGAIAYIGQGATLVALDVSDPGHIRRLSHISLPDFAQQIQPAGDFAYVANGSGGLQIVDTSDPSHLTLRGAYATTGGAIDLEVVGASVYLVETTPTTSTLQIIDVTDPTRPALRGSYAAAAGERFFGVDVVGEYAYIASSGHLIKIKISDPAQPQFVGRSIALNEMQDVEVAGNLAVAVEPASENGVGRVLLFDVSGSGDPTLLGMADNRGRMNHYARVEVVGALAYAIGRDGLDIVDISNPASPLFVRESEFGGSDLQIIGSRAYLARPPETGAESNLQILDIQSGIDLGLSGEYSLFSELNDVQAQPGVLYLAQRSHKLSCVDITDRRAPTSLDLGQLGDGYSLTVVNTTLYLGQLSGALEIFDVSEPANPALRGTYNPIRHYYTDIEVSGPYAFVAELLFDERGIGINVLDVSDPTDPRYVSTIDQFPGGSTSDLDVVDSTLYIASNLGVVILDAADPAHLRLAGHYPGLQSESIEIVGSLAYVTAADGLYILDISDRTAPAPVSHFATPRTILPDIQVVDGLAYIADGARGLLIVDVSDPTSPVLAARYDIPGGATSLAVADGFIYLASQVGGLQIVRLATSATPHQMYIPFVTTDRVGAQRGTS